MVSRKCQVCRVEFGPPADLPNRAFCSDVRRAKVPFSIEVTEKIEGDSIRYRVLVDREQEIEVTIHDIIPWRRFKRAVMRELRFVPVITSRGPDGKAISCEHLWTELLNHGLRGIREQGKASRG